MDFFESRRLYYPAVPPKEHRIPSVYPAGTKNGKWYFMGYDKAREARGLQAQYTARVGDYWETAEALLRAKGLLKDVETGPNSTSVITTKAVETRATRLTPEGKQGGSQLTVSALLGQYEKHGKPAKYDRDLARTLARELASGAHLVKDINGVWAGRLVTAYKAKRLTSQTIKQKIECLGRALEWHFRQEAKKLAEALGGGIHAETEAYSKMPRNPLKTMDPGYADYTAEELNPGEAKPENAQRDRRLWDGELDAILAVVRGEKKAKGRTFSIFKKETRPEDREAMCLFFFLLVNTAMRMSEVMTLRNWQVQIMGRNSQFILPKTVTKAKADRTVPMTPAVLKATKEWLAREGAPRGRDDPIFPMFYDGCPHDSEQREAQSNRMSQRLNSAIDAAGIMDLRVHDLRHEGVCRWVQMRLANGQWAYKKEEVMKITGHESDEMFFRYLSLRGSDAAERLYEGIEEDALG
jgi:integrase